MCASTAMSEHELFFWCVCCSLEHWSSCDGAGSSLGCRLFASCGELGLLFMVVHGLLIAVASLAVEHGLEGPQASLVATHRLNNCSSWALEHVSSVAVAHRPSCSIACGIFQAQGSNPRLLHWQVDFVPLRHQWCLLLSYLILHLLFYVVFFGVCDCFCVWVWFLLFFVFWYKDYIRFLFIFSRVLRIKCPTFKYYLVFTFKLFKIVLYFV